MGQQGFQLPERPGHEHRAHHLVRLPDRARQGDIGMPGIDLVDLGADMLAGQGPAHHVHPGKPHRRLALRIGPDINPLGEQPQAQSAGEQMLSRGRGTSQPLGISVSQGLA